MLGIYRRLLNITDNRFFIPIILFGLVVVCYGLLIPFLGYYLDDWYILWFKDAFGASQLIQYFNLDRPLEGYYFIAANFLAGDSITPLVWQIITLITRYLSVLLIWIFLNLVWPRHQRQNNSVAFFAAVYPGFTQTSMIQYSFHFFCLACLFLSFALMIKAINHPKKYWWLTLLATFFGSYAYAGADFFAGLELLRPLILWIVFARIVKKKTELVLKTIKFSIPFTIAYLVFIIWRVFFYQSENHKLAINVSMLNAPIQFMIDFLRKTWQAAVDGVVNAWGKVFNIQFFPNNGLVFWLILFSVLILLIVFWFILNKYLKENDSEDFQQSFLWRKEALLLSTGALIVTIVPFWAADLQIGINHPYDRFLLPYLFGSSLFLVALLETHGKFRKINMGVICLFIALGAGNQIANVNRYKNQWENQKDLYWQIVWRMPQIAKGTTLWTYQLPENAYFTGSALAAQLNWTYSGTGYRNNAIDYNFILINSGQSYFLPDFISNQSFDSSNRTYTFHGNTSNSVYLHKESNNCLRILDTNLTPVLSVVSEHNNKIIEAAALSNLELIGKVNGNTAQPIYEIVGKEPSHNWCYFFEKAELARQQKDYPAVINLLSETKKLGLKPISITEWYPFIDSLGRTGNWDEAEILSKTVAAEGRIPAFGVCNIWKQFEKENTENAELTIKIKALLHDFGCG